jgi:nitrile hydratase accessory protein
LNGTDDDALAPRPRESPDEPVFDEPWQAQVLALADNLAASGVFTRSQWSQALGEELRKVAAQGKPDDQTTYYEAALAALEQLTAAHGGPDGVTLQERAEAWRRAYLNTPHGEPVELAAGLKE